MLYFIVVLFFNNMILHEANNNLSKSLSTIYTDLKVEHETFKACESGELKEYREWKRKLLLE